MRNSPLTKTPPAKLSSIPDIIHEHTETGSPPVTTGPKETRSETGRGWLTYTHVCVLCIYTHVHVHVHHIQ